MWDEYKTKIEKVTETVSENEWTQRIKKDINTIDVACKWEGINM